LNFTALNKQFWNYFGQQPTPLLMATLRNNFIKKSHRTKKFYATAQNTLSFFLLTHKPPRKKNERVFSPTLYFAAMKILKSYLTNLQPKSLSL
jgi:hypothetical protein